MILLAALLAQAAPMNQQSGDVSRSQHFGRWLLVEKKVHNPIKMMSPGDHWEQYLSIQAVGDANVRIETTRSGLCVQTADGMELSPSIDCDSGTGFPAKGKEGRFFDEILVRAPSAQALDDIRATRADFIMAIKVMREDAQTLYSGIHNHPPVSPCPNCVY